MPSTGENVEQMQLSCIVGRNVKWHRRWGECLVSSSKAEHTITLCVTQQFYSTLNYRKPLTVNHLGPTKMAVSYGSIYNIPKENEGLCPTKDLYKDNQGSFICNSQQWTKSQVSNVV